MTQQGGCHCGAVRYTVEGEPAFAALCHCSDCTKSAGAPMVGWAMFPEDQLSVQGTPTTYASSEAGVRHFCGICGTGLFYTNSMIEMLQGKVDVQISTLDDPNAFPPSIHVQMADAADWEADAHSLPQFARFPG